MLGNIPVKTELGLGFRQDIAPETELSHTVGMKTLLDRIAYGNISETNLFAYANQTFFLGPQLVLSLIHI